MPSSAAGVYQRTKINLICDIAEKNLYDIIFGKNTNISFKAATLQKRILHDSILKLFEKLENQNIPLSL